MYTHAVMCGAWESLVVSNNIHYFFNHISGWQANVAFIRPGNTFWYLTLLVVQEIARYTTFGRALTLLYWRKDNARFLFPRHKVRGIPLYTFQSRLYKRISELVFLCVLYTTLNCIIYFFHLRRKKREVYKYIIVSVSTTQLQAIRERFFLIRLWNNCSTLEVPNGLIGHNLFVL